MKIIVITTLLTFLFLPESVFSQSQNWWRVNGNSAGSNQFLGTTNNQSLNFRTNNLDRMQILPNGQFRLNSFALGNSGLLTFDATGLLTPLLFNGTGNMVLSNNGSFVPASSFSNWTLDGNYLFTENTFVGIGTQNPSKTLTVEGDALITGTITTTGFNVLQKIQADTIKGTIRLDVNGNLTLGEEGGYNGITSKNEELRINSRPGYDHNVVINANTNGNLGIGVTNPQEKFDLFGNARLSGDMIFSAYADPNDSLGKILFVDDNGRTQAKSLDQMQQSMYVSKFCDLNDPNFVVNNPTWANGPNKIFVECPQVNIGIGTNGPRVNLDVLGTTFSNKIFIGGQPEVSSERLRITGYSELSNTDIFVINNASNNLLSFSNQGILKLNYFSSTPSNVFSINANSDNILTVTDKGELLINGYNSERPLEISSDGYKILQLNSNGLLRLRELKIDQNQWADYVFDTDYELMSIEELSSYISKNKHLPGVPSELELQESGVNVAEMNKILMEKIEELTLYIIDQNKKIETLIEEQNLLKEKTSNL